MTGPPPGGPIGDVAHVLFFYALLLFACGYAARAGGGPERAVAAILLLATAATWGISIAGRGYYAGQFHRGGVELGILAVDALLVLALTVVAVAADRFWPLWMTAIHAFGLIGHVAKGLAPDILPNVYQAAHAFSAYPGLLLLIAATRWHRQRVRATGHDPSWSSFSGGSTRWRQGAGQTG